MESRNWRGYVEIGGVAAIVVSLILLAYEIRQNTLAVQATALQQHFQQHAALVQVRLDNPALQAVYYGNARGGLDALTDDEGNLFIPYAANVMRNHFVAFELMQSGLLPESQWRTFEAALRRSLIDSQGARELWKRRRDEYSAEFQDLVDDIVSDAEANQPSEIG